MINFNCSKEEMSIVKQIVKKYNDGRKKNGFDAVNVMDTQMDIVACHMNGCPLRLKDMLGGRMVDVAHDIVGIGNNICTETGKLKNCFLPRFSLKSNKKSN